MYSRFQSLMTTRAWASDQKTLTLTLTLKHSSRTSLLKDSTNPFRHGYPGGMKHNPTRLPGPARGLCQQRNTAGWAALGGQAIQPINQGMSRGPTGK